MDKVDLVISVVDCNAVDVEALDCTTSGMVDINFAVVVDSKDWAVVVSIEFFVGFLVVEDGTCVTTDEGKTRT